MFPFFYSSTQKNSQNRLLLSSRIFCFGESMKKFVCARAPVSPHMVSSYMVSDRRKTQVITKTHKQTTDHTNTSVRTCLGSRDPLKVHQRYTHTNHSQHLLPWIVLSIFLPPQWESAGHTPTHLAAGFLQHSVSLVTKEQRFFAFFWRRGEEEGLHCHEMDRLLEILCKATQFSDSIMFFFPRLMWY